MSRKHTYKNCPYCGQLFEGRTMCSKCKKKLAVVRQLQDMLRPIYTKKVCRIIDEAEAAMAS